MILDPHSIISSNFFLLATVGISETVFEVEGSQFRMYDVGGQRGERKKWISHFDDVRAIIFVVSLIEYDQVLREDLRRNRMAESVALFGGITSLPWFRSTAVILFMNKSDLFEEKIKKSDPGKYFSEYKGGCNEDEAYKFFTKMYIDAAGNRQIYIHRTTATDTSHMTVVWTACKSIILRNSLIETGFLVADSAQVEED
mmetsp:Transcript_17372/g.26058  ORF Transcript_17372/g.26058 Transcript_17372/m.26058 type:complete len:199 (+) Transcript_17372:707-1303(+)